MSKIFIVEISEVNQRIDRFLAVKLNHFTRSQIHKLWDNSSVLVNGSRVAKSYRLVLGDLIDVKIKDNKTQILPEDLQLDIVYEEDTFLVVNKSQGMLMYPTPHCQIGTLVNGLKFLYGEQLSTTAGEHRAGIVHRLDKDTSGLVLVAKDNQTHEFFINEMLHRRVGRFYQAVVHGEPSPKEGEINLPLGRHKKIPVIQAVVESGRSAITFYKVLKYYPNFTHLELKLGTGRTHQIRVHLAAVNHPVAGDPLYSRYPKIPMLKGQCLHAYKLEFNHPKTGERLTFKAPLPPYFIEFIDSLQL